MKQVLTSPKPTLIEMMPSSENSPHIKDDFNSIPPDTNEIDSESPDYPGLLELEKLLKDELKKIMPNINSASNQVGNTPTASSIGTQININSLNIDMSSKTVDEDSQCLVIDREVKEKGLVLGSGQVNNDLLTKVVKNFFRETTDRRKYKGKHKNSPMVIKFYD